MGISFCTTFEHNVVRKTVSLCNTVVGKSKTFSAEVFVRQRRDRVFTPYLNTLAVRTIRHYRRFDYLLIVEINLKTHVPYYCRDLIMLLTIEFPVRLSTYGLRRIFGLIFVCQIPFARSKTFIILW